MKLQINKKKIYFQVNFTSNCNYDYELLYFDHLIDFTREKVCPDVAKSDEYCDLLIGRKTSPIPHKKSEMEPLKASTFYECYSYINPISCRGAFKAPLNPLNPMKLLQSLDCV